MVVAADDVGDAHVMIVDHDRQHVGRRAVRAQQDEIVDLGIGDGDPALDQVVDRGFAFARRLDADDVGLAVLLRARRRSRAIRCRCGTGGARPAPSRAARPAPRASGSSDRRRRARAARARLRRGASRTATGNRARRRRSMPEPVEPVEDRVDRRLGRAGLVGVLDPQQIFAAVVAGEQPVEQRGAGAADVEDSRSARGRSASRRPGFCCLRSSALSFVLGHEWIG